MEVLLPGIGWDNLHNVEMGELFEYDYSTCQLNKFLIPDGFFATHLHVGAILVQEDCLKNTLDTQDDTIKQQIRAKANADFFGRIDLVQVPTIIVLKWILILFLHILHISM